MKLHYSQTGNFTNRGHTKLDYHMKLHYSQTVMIILISRALA